VLDLTRVLAGPWAAQNLADLGAEVIKIERPGTGDDTRAWGPPWWHDGDGNETRESAYFLSVNRGKKSVTLDLSKPVGQRIARDLAAKSDVLIENYKVGTLTRYGLGYEDIRAINPGIIYCSVTGFGQDGPYASRPGYDFIFQGMGGLMSITGERDGQPGGGPQKVGIAITDVLTGMYASLAITAAITARQTSGAGQYIETALLDTIVAFGANQILNYWCSGNVPPRFGNAHANIVPYEAFPTSDGHIILAVGNDGQYASFCRVAGRPELIEDPRFLTNPDRVKHREVLVPIVREIMRTRTRQEWIAALEAAGVPCGPINNYAEVFENEQVRHRGLRVDIPGPLGAVPTVASPMRFSATPVQYDLPPPLLGEHTREVLAGVLGMKDPELDALAAQRVI
jgi:formyl-CoA transferase